MTIEHYSFGCIRLNGKEYTSDLIIYPDRIDAKWWRKEGHLLDPEDLTEVLAAPPAVLVIGTGYSGCMEVPPATLETLRAAGIEVRAAPTGKAVEQFNSLQAEKKQVVAALHLTC